MHDQIVQSRRNQILDAASKIFAEKGFHLTTIKDIAREANIADGTIYLYFQNKTALLLGIFDRMQASVTQAEELPQPATGSLHTLLRTLLQHPLMALGENNFALFRVVMSEMMVNQELRRLYYERLLAPSLKIAEALFEQLATQGLIQTGNIRLATRAMTALILGMLTQNIIGDEALQNEWASLPDYLADLLVNGIGSNAK